MNRRFWALVVGVAVSAATGAISAPARAQAAEVKEKPPLYMYESMWAIPRARWADMDKMNAGLQKVLDKAVASGLVVAYGDDSALVHEADGATHDSWFQSLSLAGVFKTLDEIYKAGGAAGPVLESATKHWDNLYVARYYNWHPGTWKGAYIMWHAYQLRETAPPDAVATLARSFYVPMLEKLLADGAIVEYEIDTQVIHTEDPGGFAVCYIAANAEGLDKVRAALTDAIAKAPLAMPAVNALVDFAKHRDALARSDLTYK
jgi:hypothetical protein